MRLLNNLTRLGLSASTIAIVATLGTPAVAQTQPTTQPVADPTAPPPLTTPPTATPQSEGSIVVTGTRIKRPEFSNPNPTQTFTAETLQEAGTTNLTDILVDLPALQGSQTNVDVSGSNLASAQSVGVNLLNLRNLGTNRTLVLVNGRRHIAGFPGSASVDINTIPTDLIDRIDIETGGTSAVYGSDGVSGVVNFILKRDFSGLSVRGQYSISQRNDAGNKFISATYGKNFADGRGNIALSYEYNQIDRFSQRNRLNWGMTGPSYRFVRNPADHPDDPNIPDYVPLNNLLWVDTSPGGAIDLNLDYYPDFTGEGTPYDRGTLVPGSAFTIGGDSTPQDSYFGDYILGGQHHIANLFGHFDVSDALRFFVEGKYVRAKGATFAQPTYDFYDYLLPDNAYLIQRFGPDAAPDGAFITGRDNFDFGIRRYSTVRDTWRGVFGVEGDLSKHLRYEASINYGQVKSTGTNQGDRITDRYFAAMDTVVNPANGQITCRINLPGETEIQMPFTLTTAYLGGAPTTFQPGQCVPINLFGYGSPSQQALDFVLATHTDHAKISQTVVNGYISGDSGAFFSLPGGPVGFALGAEYRRETSLDIPSAYSQMTIPTFNSLGEPIQVGALIDNSLASVESGHFDVKEAFAEINLPILSKVPFADTLSIGAAGRVSDYSTVGTQKTWSLNGIYAPIPDISFRGTLSQAVRAPNVTELFAGNTGTFEFINDPCGIDRLTSGTQYRAANCATILTAIGINPATFDPANSSFSPANSSIQGFTSGNANLSAETARTWTAGVVLRPRFIRNLNMAFDWYNIRIKDAVNTATAQELVELCVDQPTIQNIFCPNVTRSAANGFVSSFHVVPQNVAQFKTAGLDMTLNYRFAPFRNFGSFNLSVKGNYLKTLQFIPSVGADVDEDVTEPFSPKWSATGDLTWKKNGLTVNYGINWFSRTRRSPIELTDANPDRFAPQYKWYKEYWEHEAQIGYDLTKQVNMYFGVRNLLDTKPDVGAAGYPISAVGRSFYVGLRLRPF